MQKRPADAVLLIYQGWLLRKVGRLQESVEAYSAVLKGLHECACDLHECAPVAWSGTLHTTASVCLCGMGRKEDPLQAARKGVNVGRPDDFATASVRWERTV